jgi:hypothetical protein
MSSDEWHTLFQSAQEPLIQPRIEAIANLVQKIRQDFDDEKDASDRNDWCNEVPRQLKLDTVKSYLTAMYDKTTMCTVTCATCQVKTAPEDTERLQWEAEMSRPLKEFFSTKLACRQCFPADQSPGDELCVLAAIRAYKLASHRSTVEGTFDLSHVPIYIQGN